MQNTHTRTLTPTPTHQSCRRPAVTLWSSVGRKVTFDAGLRYHLKDKWAGGEGGVLFNGRLNLTQTFFLKYAFCEKIRIIERLATGLRCLRIDLRTAALVPPLLFRKSPRGMKTKMGNKFPFRFVSFGVFHSPIPFYHPLE